MQSSLSNILFLCSLGGNISCSSSFFFFKHIQNSCLKIQDISQNLPQSHESKLVRCSRLHSRSFGIVKIGSFRELLQAICHRCSFHSPCTGFTQQPPIIINWKVLKMEIFVCGVGFWMFLARKIQWFVSMESLRSLRSVALLMNIWYMNAIERNLHCYNQETQHTCVSWVSSWRGQIIQNVPVCQLPIPFNLLHASISACSNSVQQKLLYAAVRKGVECDGTVETAFCSLVQWQIQKI